MQSDSSTLYGDLVAKQLTDHQNDGDYSFSAASASLHDLYHPRHVMQKHQDMINHHNLCLTRLHEATKEAEELRQQNTALRSVNHDLNKQLGALIQASLQNHFSPSDSYNATPFELANELERLCLGGGGVGEEEVSDESPTSMREGAGDQDRVMLPKSISVRSNGYLKMSPQTAGVSGRGKTRGPTRPGNASQLNGGVKVQQKVYVQGGQKEEEPLELEVYNQGMLKTELCSKWQETGACPYDNHCQFAHGIEELRPIIRHPRYKTEVCRMILAGDVCPYGHRCHFRHALTEEEKLMGYLKPQNSCSKKNSSDELSEDPWKTIKGQIYATNKNNSKKMRKDANRASKWLAENGPFGQDAFQLQDFLPGNLQVNIDQEIYLFAVR